MKKLIAGALLLGAATLAMAQAWPTAKPIRLIVGYPPGGGIDFAARTVQVPLQELLKQQIVVDYKPGAGGMLAATELTRAAPDGYTLLLANTGPFAIAPYLQRKMPYDPLKQFSYIGQISQGSYIAVTRPDHPAKDLKEWVAWAKANAGKVNFASGGAGTSTHLNGELMNQATGLDVTHVPYKGSAPAVQDLIGGQTQLLIDAGPVLLPQVKGGKLKALAVSGKQRLQALPDVPTGIESGYPGFEATSWTTIAVGAKVPDTIADQLNADIRKVVATPAFQKGLQDQGMTPVASPRDVAASFITGEKQRWDKVIAEGKLNAD